MLDASFLKIPLAHRALHDLRQGRPENSRAAIRAAIAVGYGIEIDLQLSSDGHAMVFHDYALDRLTDQSGPIRQRSASDLQSIALTGEHDGAGIPTFAEILELVGGRVPLLVELKDQDGAMGTNVGTLERSVAAAARNYRGPMAFMSFNPNSVAVLAEIAPDWPRGLVTEDYTEGWALLPAAICERLKEIPDFDRVGACFISHQIKSLNSAPVQALKQRGVPVLCWTVRSPEQEAEARKISDNITFEGYRPEFPA